MRKKLFNNYLHKISSFFSENQNACINQARNSKYRRKTRHEKKNIIFEERLNNESKIGSNK